MTSILISLIFLNSAAVSLHLLHILVMFRNWCATLEQVLSTLISLNAINVCVTDSWIKSMSKRSLYKFFLDISQMLKNSQFLLKQWVMMSVLFCFVFFFVFLCFVLFCFLFFAFFLFCFVFCFLFFFVFSIFYVLMWQLIYRLAC